MPVVKSWSFTAWSVYDQCPLKYKLSKIDRLREPKSVALERGNAVHAAIEAYIRGRADKLPTSLGIVVNGKTETVAAEYKHFFKLISNLRKRVQKKNLVTIVEDSWALTKDWARTTWAEGWLRLKLDVAWTIGKAQDVLIITDWKTGKYRPDDLEKYLAQLQLYALVALLLYPHVKAVQPRLAFLDSGDLHPGEGQEILEYTREDISRLKEIWMGRIAPMFADKKFDPKPNRFCSWCHFRASNKENGGGQCRF